MDLKIRIPVDSSSIIENLQKFCENEMNFFKTMSKLFHMMMNSCERKLTLDGYEYILIPNEFSDSAQVKIHSVKFIMKTLNIFTNDVSAITLSTFVRIWLHTESEKLNRIMYYGSSDVIKMLELPLVVWSCVENVSRMVENVAEEWGSRMKLLGTGISQLSYEGMFISYPSTIVMPCGGVIPFFDIVNVVMKDSGDLGRGSEKLLADAMASSECSGRSDFLDEEYPDLLPMMAWENDHGVIDLMCTEDPFGY